MFPVRALLPATVAMAFGGCMFFRSLDDLTGGAEDAGTSLPVDAHGDDVRDASTPTPEAASTSPCIDAGKRHTLCEDFDRGELDASFGGIDLTAGATVAASEARAQSLPRSLLSTIERRSASVHENLGGRAEQFMKGAFTHARLEFDIYLERPAWQPGDLGVALATVYFKSDTTQAGIIIWRAPDSTFLSTEVVPQDYFDSPNLPYDRWAHVVLDYRIGGTFSYVIDGVSGSRAAPNADLGPEPWVTLSMGLVSFDAPNAAMRAYYDNVVYDLD